MNHVIIDGVDRLGKNSVILELIKSADNAILRHFTVPLGNTNKEKIEYQKKSFLFEFRLAQLPFKIQEISKTNSDLIIWNRSHIGEKIYGELYRNYNADWIYEMEKLFNFDKRDDVFLILLTADPEFAFAKEDGKSLSNTVEERKTEINLFLDAVKKSNIKNKLILKVNDGNNFLSKHIINEKIRKFINKE